MQTYTPVYATEKVSMGQIQPAAASIAPAPTPTIDAVFAGYQGIPGLLATLGVLTVAGSAAWLGINTALKTEDKTKKYVGWVGGIGSALLGLLYLGQKSGFTIGTGVPAVNVYPA